jgi:hypothetical protein
MKKQAIACFSAFHQPLEPLQDAFSGCPGIHEHADILHGKAEMLQQDVTNIGNVVDAARQITAGKLIRIDADQKSLVAHDNPLVHRNC